MAPRQVKAVKKVLSAGRGPLPEYRDGTKAFFNYEVLLPLNDVKKQGFSDCKDDYKSIDDTRKPYPDGYGKPLELVFGKKFQLPIFETCLSSMHIGEVCQFDIDERHLHTYPMISKKLRDISRAAVDPKHKPHHEGHHCAAMGPVKLGYEELDELNENPKPLRIIFHMLDVVQPENYEAESWQLNVEEKMASLDTLRLQGNDLFKAGKFEEATIKYREALGRVDTLLLREKPGDPEWVELDRKNISLYLNLSQCYLNMSQYYDAVRTASEVLKREETNEKALFRRAKGRIGTWELDQAEEDLNKLLELYPSAKRLVDAERAILAERRKQDEAKSKSVFKEMMKDAMFTIVLIYLAGSSLALPISEKNVHATIEKPAKIAVDAKLVERPDHLEAIPLERDGDVNRNFVHEVLLGEDNNDFKSSTAEDKKHGSLTDLIKKMFASADKNKDGKLSRSELMEQIVSNVLKHLDEGETEAKSLFSAVDENQDGKVNWDEYKVYFMIAKRIVDADHAREHSEHMQNLGKETRLMMQDEEEAFNDADKNSDGLDEREWIGFRHPEHSDSMLTSMADEIIKSFDKNDDGVLTKSEFAQLPPGEVDDASMEKEYLKEREEEFDQIDADHDGKATREEILHFLNPRNERHATNEVQEIMSIADDNRDDHLTLEELLAKKDLLDQTGFVRPVARLHDDL